MEKKLSNGRFPSDLELLEKVKNSRSGFIMEECRCDIVHSEKENWFYPNTTGMDMTDNMAPLYTPTPEGKSALKEIRDMTAIANKEAFDKLVKEHPEWSEWCYFKEYKAKPCVEEPNGPEVPILMLHLKDAFKHGPYPTLIIPSWGGFINNDLYGFMPPLVAQLLGCQIMTVSPRSIVDAEYPAAINDMHAAYQWLVNHAEELNVDLDRIVIYGMSGCSVPAASLPFRLKRYGWLNAPMPRGVVIEDGFLDDRECERSGRTITKLWDAPTCRAGMMLYMGQNFASSFIGPEAFANHATVEECRGICPFALQVCQDSPGCDISIKFAEKLNQAGVAVSLYQVQCCSHDRPSYEEYISPMIIRASENKLDIKNDLNVATTINSFILGNIKDYFENDFRRL